jgi:hypothetical protein
MKKLIFLHPNSESLKILGRIRIRIRMRTKMSRIRNTGSRNDRSLLNGRALYVLYSSLFCETSNIVVLANDSSCRLIWSHIRLNVFSMAGDNCALNMLLKVF